IPTGSREMPRKARMDKQQAAEARSARKIVVRKSDELHIRFSLYQTRSPVCTLSNKLMKISSDAVILSPLPPSFRAKRGICFSLRVDSAKDQLCLFSVRNIRCFAALSMTSPLFDQSAKKTARRSGPQS